MVLSKEFRAGLSWDPLCAVDLALNSSSIRDLEHQYVARKGDMEAKDFCVKVKKRQRCLSPAGTINPKTKLASFLVCCGKRVGSKSILCPSYKHWIYHHCCWIRGSLSDAVNFICPICQDGTHLDSQPQPPVTLAGNNLEVVDKFCYLDDMLVTAMTVKSLPPSQG